MVTDLAVSAEGAAKLRVVAVCTDEGALVSGVDVWGEEAAELGWTEERG